MPRRIKRKDISWFLDLREKGQLNLEPPYQRRSVWSISDKRYFIDTILNNCPAPPVFLHEELCEDGRSIFHVVDGKQRLQTIFQFRDGEIHTPDDLENDNLQKKYWKKLDDSIQRGFLDYTLIVEMLSDTKDLTIKDIFDRLNRNSRKLNRQEIRHAKHDGWFIKFVEREIKRAEWKKFGIVTVARVRRMSDVQFLSELCAIILKNTLYGFDQRQLDELYAEYEDTEEIVDFSLDNFSDYVEQIKAIINYLIGIDPDIKKYLKIQSHFYSLWGYLYLERISYRSRENLAERYKDFMGRSMEIVSASKTPDTLPPSRKSKSLTKMEQAEQNYANGFQGANTDLTQREMRHSGLVYAMNRR